jgi:rubrerythrin
MSLSDKKLKDFVKDEKAGVITYKKAAKKVHGKRAKNTFRRMAKDEKRHEHNLEDMLKQNDCSKKPC